MKHIVRSVIKNIHVYLGLSIGLLFCMMGLSGSLLVYRAEIERALRPSWQAQGAARPALPISEAEHNVHNRWPAATVQRLVLPQDAKEPVEFLIRDNGTQTHVYCDAVTGEVLGTFEVAWLDWIVGLHHNLRLGPVGRQLVGTIGIALLLASVSGLALWLWRGMLGNGAWRTMLHINWSRPKTRNLQLHRAAGLFANLFLLLQALTGITLGFPQTFRSAVELFTGQSTERPPRAKLQDKGPRQPLEVLLQAAVQEVPGGQAREVRLPQNDRGPVTVRVWHEGDFRPEGSNQVTLNSATAAVISVDRSANWSVARRIEMTPASVHYAEWGGGPVKAVWFAIGIAPTLLFVSGLAIWWTGYRARRQVAEKQMQALLTAA